MRSLRSVFAGLIKYLLPDLAEMMIRYRSKRQSDKALRLEWETRIADVIACPDNAGLKRNINAGRIQSDFQILFNGLKSVRDGYYGEGMTELLRRNHGSHEPQEEIVFQEVLGRLPSGAKMIECGAYWGFYSMWFAREVTNATAHLIEPSAPNLEVGRRNFLANGLHGHFHIGLVADQSLDGEVPQVCIDDFCKKNQIDHLDILHADIQGFEVQMLLGAEKMLRRKMIDYIFISTHGSELHCDCTKILEANEYNISVSILPIQSFSFDGLIVATLKQLANPPLPTPSMKPTANGR